MGPLCALHELEGHDPAEVHVVVGTSAGSVLAALIGCGVPPRQMAERLAGAAADVAGTEPVNPLGVVDRVHQALGDLPLPMPLPGNLALAARSWGRPVGELVEEYHEDMSWPERPRTWVVAMDFDSGRRAVFGRPGHRWRP